MYAHSICCFFFTRRRRHTIFDGDWSPEVCSPAPRGRIPAIARRAAAWIGERLGERKLFARDDAAHGEAAPEPLADRDHVGNHVLVLDGEHLPGAPEPGDHLVADQERAELIREETRSEEHTSELQSQSN